MYKMKQCFSPIHPFLSAVFSVYLFEVRLTKPNESKTALNALHKSFWALGLSPALQIVILTPASPRQARSFQWHTENTFQKCSTDIPDQQKLPLF